MYNPVNFDAWINKGFALYKQNFALLVVTNLIAIVLSVITGGILAGPMLAGMILITLRLLRGTQPKPEIGTLFDGFNHFAQTLQFVLVWGIIYLVVSRALIFFTLCLGGAIAIVGCLTLGTLLMFAMFLIVDRGMPFWPASLASIEAVKTAFWPLLGFGLVVQLMAMSGNLLCGIGAIFTLPIYTCAMAIAYEDFMSSPTPPPSA